MHTHSTHNMHTHTHHVTITNIPPAGRITTQGRHNVIKIHLPTYLSLYDHGARLTYTSYVYVCIKNPLYDSDTFHHSEFSNSLDDILPLSSPYVISGA